MPLRRSIISHLGFEESSGELAVNNYESSINLFHAPTMSIRRAMLKLTMIFNVLHGKIVFPSFPLTTKITPYARMQIY